MNKQTKMHVFPFFTVFSQPSFRLFLMTCLIVAGNLDWFYPKIAYAKTTEHIQSIQENDNSTPQEATNQTAERPMVIILDSSNSMWGEIKGEDKMDIAKQAINDLLKQWPDHKSLGIIGFSGESSKKDCRKVKMLYPVSSFDLDKAKQSIEKINPNGFSAIHYSLEKAASLLEKTNGGEILLISDGTESCEEKNPCDLAKTITQQQTIRIHTLNLAQGLDPTRDGKDNQQSASQRDNEVSDTNELNCIAKAGQGEAYTLASLDQLIQKTKRPVITLDADTPKKTVSLIKHPKKPKGQLRLSSSEDSQAQKTLPATYLIYNEKNDYLGRYSTEGELTVDLPVGKYSVMVVYDPIKQAETFVVDHNETVQHNFVLGKSNEIGVTALHDNVPVTAHFSVFNEAGELLTTKMSKQAFRQRLPVGRYKLAVAFDNQEQKVDIEVTSEKTNNHYWLVF
ncbi:MAG: vWA domain-containing protein [bacterium]